MGKNSYKIKIIGKYFWKIGNKFVLLFPELIFFFRGIIVVDEWF